MVATAFIFVFSLAVIVAQAGHWNMVLTSRDRTTATHLAEETMESAMAMRYDDLVDTAFPDLAYGTIPSFPNFRREVQIVENTGVKTITVIVSWRKADRAKRPVMLTTTITQRPESAS